VPEPEPPGQLAASQHGDGTGGKGRTKRSWHPCPARARCDAAPCLLPCLRSLALGRDGPCRRLQGRQSPSLLPLLSPASKAKGLPPVGEGTNYSVDVRPAAAANNSKTHHGLGAESRVRTALGPRSGGRTIASPTGRMVPSDAVKDWAAIPARGPGKRLGAIGGSERAPSIIFRRSISRGSERPAPTIVVQRSQSPVSEPGESGKHILSPDDDDLLPPQRHLTHVEVRAAPGRAVHPSPLQSPVCFAPELNACVQNEEAQGESIDLRHMLAQTSDLVAVAHRRVANFRADGGPKHAKKKKKAKSPEKSRSMSPRKSAASPGVGLMNSPTETSSGDRPQHVGFAFARAEEEDKFCVKNAEQSKWKLILDKNRMAGSGQVKCAKKTCEELAFMSVVEVEAVHARSIPGR